MTIFLDGYYPLGVGGHGDYLDMRDRWEMAWRYARKEGERHLAAREVMDKYDPYKPIVMTVTT